MSLYSTVPQVSIKIDDTELSSEIIQTIQFIRVTQLLSAPSQCEILLPEAHPDFASTALLQIGNSINITTDNPKYDLFSGQITKIDYQYDAALKPLISIRAYDRLHQLRKRQPVRSHIQVNLNQLAQELTQDLGLSIEGGDTTPTISSLIQYKQSDLQLLSELGECYGQYFFLKNDNLLFRSLKSTETTEQLTLGENLLEIRFSTNAETVTEAVTTTGWNPQHCSTHSSTAQNSELKDNALVNSSDFNTNAQRILVDAEAQNDIQAEAISQKELDRHLAQQLTLWGVVDGNPELTPGKTVEIFGVAEPLTGSYVLTEVSHTIDTVKGFISEINTTPPIIEKTKAAKNATIGIVSQVNDPEQLGRVKVNLPTYNNIETEWLEVLTSGAGSNKGQLALPDIGDTVLLLIVNGEPSQSIVLGGLYGDNELPESMIVDGSVKRYITQTAGKQRILLDDSDSSIRLETESGHRIEMSPKEIKLSHNNGNFVSLSNDNLTIHSETDLNIQAPGSAITFRGKTIDFEEAK